MKESSHCTDGFIHAWFVVILLYVSTMTMVFSANIANMMKTLDNMEAYQKEFAHHAMTIADVRCRLKQPKDEEGNIDFSPYIFNEQMHTVSAYSQEEMIVIQLNEEHTFIVSYTIIHCQHS